MVVIGKCRLPHLMRLRGITASQLCDRSGLSQPQVSDYIHNRRVMSLKTARIVAGVLLCSIDDLYEWIETEDEAR